MNPDEYHRLSALESDMWWFRGMEQISTAVLESYAGPLADGPTRMVLDAGCGTGGMLATLRRYGPTVGMDAAPAALELASMKGATPLVQATVMQLPFVSEVFDLVTSFDVLYHRNVRDDRTALSELERVMKKKGILLLRVPAYDRLRSRHDEAVHSRQRYGKRELMSKLRSVGLDPIFVSFANTILFPAAVARRVSEPWRTTRTGSEVETVAPWLNRLLASVLGFEAFLLRRFSLPFGLSLVAVARKAAR